VGVLRGTIKGIEWSVEHICVVPDDDATMDRLRSLADRIEALLPPEPKT